MFMTHVRIISFFEKRYRGIMDVSGHWLETKMKKIKILKNGEIVEGNQQDLEARHATVWLDVTAPTPEEWELVAQHAEAPV